jgi:hypothetical protein
MTLVPEAGVDYEQTCFARSDVDQAVFHCKRNNDFMIMMVHVDDCTIILDSLVMICDFKQDVGAHVKITDLGDLHWLLGIKIIRE